MTDISAKITQLEKEIAGCPHGCISKKNISGKIRYYLQWSENGKTKSRYLKADEVDVVRAGVEKRKALQKELHKLRQSIGVNTLKPTAVNSYSMNILLGSALDDGCKKASAFDTRSCFADLENYLNAETFGKVCLVYGLRRTGKTTMLFQAMAKLPREKTVYIKATTLDTMAKLNDDMKRLAAEGYKYVFLDEVTLLEDFIDSAALFSDIYAMQGMKIVLSGTDSLGFWFAGHEELYDRAYTIHTTFIPFCEHSRLLGIHDIDEYIRYGGTLKAGTVGIDTSAIDIEKASFADDESTRIYIDTAICKNIQHSLECCESGGHFRHLQDLYDAGELTNAINRIIEDMNHRFVLSVLTKSFRSNDLHISQKNLRKESDILDKIDESAVIERLKNVLEIKEKEELSVELTVAHIAEIKQYLKALDLIVESPVNSSAAAEPVERCLITQPGMRFCQAQTLVEALIQDTVFASYSEREKKLACERILNEVRGRMTEDIVLLECAKFAKKYHRVFKLQFDVGEFDMVIYNSESDTCEVFEIKHSDKIAPKQYMHLVDEDKCAETEKRYGKIKNRYVLYRGNDTTLNNGIIYKNVEKFLENLI